MLIIYVMLNFVKVRIDDRIFIDVEISDMLLTVLRIYRLY